MSGLDGGTMLALHVAGLTNEEIDQLDKIVRRQPHSRYIFWFDNAEETWTSGKHHLYTASELVPGSAEMFARKICDRTNSSHVVLVLCDGKVPHGACIPPEWRSEP